MVIRRDTIQRALYHFVLLGCINNVGLFCNVSETLPLKQRRQLSVTLTRISSGIWSRLLPAMCELSKCRKYQKNLCSRKVGQSSPKSPKTCYPLRLPIIPNFIEINQTSLEKSVTKIGLRTKKFFYHGQKCDYLSRVSQRASGATKNPSFLIQQIKL